MHDNLSSSDCTDDAFVIWPIPPEIARWPEQSQIGKYHTEGVMGL
jgi:hypothetical protein